LWPVTGCQRELLSVQGIRWRQFFRKLTVQERGKQQKKKTERKYNEE
jgi:hypothetical protein